MAIEMIETVRSLDEHTSQSLLFDWMRITPAPLGLPGMLADYAWMNPNGLYLGKGSIGQRAGYIAKMKRAGFSPGVSDVSIAIPVLDMHGAFLELKRDMTPAAAARALSEEQVLFLIRAYNCGYFVALAAGFDHAMAAVKHYFNGGRSYGLELFAELDEHGYARPAQIERKRSKTKPKA